MATLRSCGPGRCSIASTRLPRRRGANGSGTGSGTATLAKLLKPYGIRPRDVKISDINRKGYYREQFVKSWESYAGGSSATCATSATAQVSGQIADATNALPMGYPDSQVALGSPSVAEAEPLMTREVAPVAQVADDPPAEALCEVCDGPLDPVLVRMGMATHPNCDPTGGWREGTEGAERWR